MMASMNSANVWATPEKLHLTWLKVLIQLLSAGLPGPASKQQNYWDREELSIQTQNAMAHMQLRVRLAHQL